MASQDAKRIYITPKLGLSHFTGVVGVEGQYSHFGFGVGFPLTGGIRYYTRPLGHSWFAGLFGTGYGYNHDETKDGITYTHYSDLEGGAGVGYRWFWHSRWSLELGFTAGYINEIRTNTFYRRTDTGISIAPVATSGITF